MIQEMQKMAQPLLSRIKTMPFISELANGALSEQRFINYLQQDYLFLQDFSYCLSLAANKVSHQQDADWLKNAAQAVIVEEHAMQKIFFKQFNVNMIEQKNLACFAYTNYLLRIAALENTEVILASLLPCFWIYDQIGRWLQNNGEADNRYQKWINNYNSEEFSASVYCLENMLQSYIANIDAENAQKVRAAFNNGCQLEYNFWDAAYELSISTLR